MSITRSEINYLAESFRTLGTAPGSQEAFNATANSLRQEASEEPVTAKVLKIATQLFSHQTALSEDERATLAGMVKYARKAGEEELYQKLLLIQAKFRPRTLLERLDDHLLSLVVSFVSNPADRDAIQTCGKSGVPKGTIEAQAINQGRIPLKNRIGTHGEHYSEFLTMLGPEGRAKLNYFDLRGLNGTAQANLLPKLAEDFPHIKTLLIKNSPVREIPEKISERVDVLECTGCTALTEIHTPIATKVNCAFCSELNALTAPEAIEIDCGNCWALVKLNALKVTKIDSTRCPGLTVLNVPNAHEINCSQCRALTTINAPIAAQIDSSRCAALKEIYAPKAEQIDCTQCTTLGVLAMPNVMTVKCSECPALTHINVPSANEIVSNGCIALKEIDAPNASKIFCDGSIALQNIRAPRASQIWCSCCTALKTITAAEGAYINSFGCTALVKITAPK